uniref:Uncharacterized protein n=1 Tax=Arundo donax TaxID=35708 RepID=A0A0A9HI68_ARUDO
MNSKTILNMFNRMSTRHQILVMFNICYICGQIKRNLRAHPVNCSSCVMGSRLGRLGLLGWSGGLTGRVH